MITQLTGFPASSQLIGNLFLSASNIAICAPHKLPYCATGSAKDNGTNHHHQNNRYPIDYIPLQIEFLSHVQVTRTDGASRSLIRSRMMSAFGTGCKVYHGRGSPAL